ncbi:uncharacterized protein [Montipora capricornis]|uniref:uncharacterized protein n=1 Tax=Montipora capricornis TaxID=246305 RepID=UPI0035F1CC39
MKITHLLYIDDLKVFSSSQTKLNTVLRSTCAAMNDIELQWNPKKCNTIHVKRGVLVHDAAGLKLDQTSVVQSIKEGSSYKFLGVCETVKQDEKLALVSAAKVYLQRLSVPWSSPLSDVNRVIATKQFALPVLSYLMWTQHWPITELRVVNREARKIIHENGGKHPLSSTAVMYLPRHLGGRGLRSVEREYKLTKIKAAVKLYQNSDPTIRTVQMFEERAVEKGHSSLLTEAHKYAEELEISLSLRYPNPSITLARRPEVEVEGMKIKELLKRAMIDKLQETIKAENWHGRLLTSRWKDEELSQDACFAWMKDWSSAPTHTVAGMIELYEQLLPTKVYTTQKTKTTQGDVSCRLCGKEAETLPHILSGCSTLAQSKYLDQHNAALKILFFEKCKDLKLVEGVPPWYSPVKPKPVYESDEGKAFWDVAVYAEHTYVRANIIDARFVDHKAKQVWAVEMSCPWIDNRAKKVEEKAIKYGPLLLELKQQHPGYKVQQCNIIIDALGGWSKDVEETMKKLVGARSKCVLEKMQKATISYSLHIARYFKAAVL